MEKLEAEYENANDRRDNIGVAENDEATMLDKIVTNFESNTSKAEITETNRVGAEKIPEPIPYPQKWTS